MPKLLPAIAATALAAALVAAPAVAADAATPTVKASTAYTLTVTGNGTRALVYWTAVRTDGSIATGAHPESPITRLPWHQRVTTKAYLYQVTAIQQHGTKLHCTIRDASGRVLSTATSIGRNAVVACMVSKRDLFSLAGLS